MKSFEQHLNGPQSDAEWIAREEEIERIEARRRRTLDLAFEDGPDIELREFRGSGCVDPFEETGCTDEEIAACVCGAYLVDEYFSRVRT